MNSRIFFLLAKTLNSLFLVAATVILPAVAIGQSLDSLEQVLNEKKLTDAEKIKIYDDLNWGYLTMDVQRSIAFGKKGLALAKKTGDLKMQAVFYKDLGLGYYMKRDYDSALLQLGQGQPVSDKLQDYDMQASFHNAHANIYQAQGRYDQALEHYFASAKIYDTHNKKKLAIPYGNIGGIYQLLKNYDQALKYFKMTEALALQYDDLEGLAGVYLSMSDISLIQKKPKAISVDYARKAIENFNKLGNKLAEINARLVLAKVYQTHEDFKAAEEISRDALSKAKEMGMPNLSAKALIILSNGYKSQQQYALSAKLANEVLATDSTDKNILRNVYSNLAIAYSYMGQSKPAGTYMELYRDLLDRYSNDNYQTVISGMEVKYETEKKQLKIEALEKQHRLNVWLGIAGAVILLVALAFALVRYRLAVSHRKLAEEKSQRLEQEKQLVAVQAALDGETSERSRLAKDLHDGLGSMLSLVKFNLPQVQGNAVVEEVDVHRFQTALGMLDDSIRELRRVAHHMMPESLLRQGLKASLSDFCEAIPVATFHFFGNAQRLSEKLEIMIYRCIHELVNNALKHAEAGHINVQLVQEPDRISFTVQDDGKGFDTEQTTEGMGLQNVRQRVAAFGGQLNIYSSGQGTEIHVELHLKENTND